jgi:hypothetical protein
MILTEKLYLSANPQGLRELANIMDSKYPGCKIAYLCSYGTNLDITLMLPEGTTIVLPQITDARATEVEE